ncbi:MAG: sigma-70 family RNA polymerase sigma factor [Roseiarcus sp.]|jgi:DNA-directed RNA polymerase specialized sigma24 family protein
METPELERGAAYEAVESATSVARALADLTETDLLRLQALARLRARGLPDGASWSDLLHEAIVRALDGSRRWPPGLPFLVFMAGVMRSLCGEIWRRQRREAELIVLRNEVETREPACPGPDQERVLAAAEAVRALLRLFADDRIALRIVNGLANGLSAQEIRAMHDLSPTEYDSARRRMRRALLRIGLTWGAP